MRNSSDQAKIACLHQIATLFGYMRSRPEVKKEEDRKCPTCDGSGEVDPDSMSKEEWNELYSS